MDLNETIRRAILAGVGAVTLTVEKSKELADALIKKGETTAAEKNISYEQVRDQIAEQVRGFAEKLRTDLKKASFDELLDRADTLDDEQRAILMDRLAHPHPAPEESCECGDGAEEPESAECGCAPEDAPADAPAEEENADQGK